MGTRGQGSLPKNWELAQRAGLGASGKTRLWTTSTEPPMGCQQLQFHWFPERTKRPPYNLAH